MSVEYSIVIPLYNEEACVERSIPATAMALDDAFAGRYELLLVMNGSTDRTRELCEKIAQRFPRIRLLDIKTNVGYGGGILKGLAHARGTFFGFTCGDGQVSPKDLVVMMREIAQGTYDLVKARRIHRADGRGRRLQSLVYNRLFRLGCGVTCADINAMPKLMRREVYERFALESTDWFFDAELMVKAHYAGLRIQELPVEYLERVGGVSAVRWYAPLQFLWNLLRVHASGRFAAWKRIGRVTQRAESALPPLTPHPTPEAISRLV